MHATRLACPYCAAVLKSSKPLRVGKQITCLKCGKAFVITRPATDDLRDPDYAKAYLLICRVQLVVFAINEFKIDYLRNNVYLFPVWVMFAVWAASAMIARSNAAAAAAHADERAALPAPAPLRVASA